MASCTGADLQNKMAGGALTSVPAGGTGQAESWDETYCERERNGGKFCEGTTCWQGGILHQKALRPDERPFGAPGAGGEAAGAAAGASTAGSAAAGRKRRAVRPKAPKRKVRKPPKARKASKGRRPARKAKRGAKKRRR